MSSALDLDHRRPLSRRKDPARRWSFPLPWLLAVARARVVFVVLLLVGVGGVGVGTAHATPESVVELVRQAREHESARRDDLAARRYTEALGLDPTCEEAYLGLGQLRARTGDAREAERVYSVALEHAPQLRAALAGRARARRAMGARDAAEMDLEAYLATERDVAAMRELAAWYGEDGRTAAQLAAWRRILAGAAAAGDAALGHEARTMVRALQIMVGPADPVVSPPEAPEGVRERGDRRAMAAIARRAG
jgi:tetratricopeptide (TPR) repeat protein